MNPDIYQGNTLKQSIHGRSEGNPGNWLALISGENSPSRLI